MSKQRRTYTQGEINLLIDSVLHPLINKSSKPKPLMAVDALFHLINEGKFEQKVRETIANTVLPKLRDRLLEGIVEQEERR